MSWIKMRCDLADDLRVWRIAERLNIPKEHVIGLMHRFWSWADGQTEDGFISLAKAEDVDRYLGVEGFAAAVEAVDWLELRDNGVALPRFETHNGRSAKRRAREAKRKGEARSGAASPDPGVVSASHADAMRNNNRETEQEKTERERTDSKSPQPRAAGDVADVALSVILGGRDLLSHPNATPERKRWIASAAVEKQNPGGWAAEAIRKGWNPPQDFERKRAEQDAEASRRDARDWLQSLPTPSRREFEREMEAVHPQLRTCTDDGARERYILNRIVETGRHVRGPKPDVVSDEGGRQ